MSTTVVVEKRQDADQPLKPDERRKVGRAQAETGPERVAGAPRKRDQEDEVERGRAAEAGRAGSMARWCALGPLGLEVHLRDRVNVANHVVGEGFCPARRTCLCSVLVVGHPSDQRGAVISTLSARVLAAAPKVS